MDEAVGRTEVRPSRASAFTDWVVRRHVLIAALVGFVLLLAAIRVWMAHKIVTPWIMSDEILYSELARSLADDHHFLVRGASFPLRSVGYPLLVSPAWLAGSMATTYELAKAINVLLMTTALIPVYFWSQRLMRPAYAALATALVALMPAFLYTGTIMTENGSFPTVMLALFVFALTLERPTLLRQLLAVAAVGLAYFVRSQALVLAAVLPVAVVVKLALDARAAKRGRRVRTFVDGWRPYLPLILLYVVGAAGYILYQKARGASLSAGLGAYAGVTTAHYSFGDVASWTVEHMAELGFAVAIFPVSALIVLLALAVGRGNEHAAQRAFLAVATSATLLIVVQVAAFASRFSMRIEERYMFFVVPLLFMALALWLDRGLPRPVIATAAATLVPVALLLALPLEKRLNVSITSDTFGLIPLLRLSYKTSVPTARLLMLAGGIVAAASFALLPRRLARVVLPSALALYLVLATIQVFRSVRDFSQATRVATAPGRLDWVDESLPKGASTGILFGPAGEPSENPITSAVRMWEVEFWNRDVKGVYNLVYEPDTFAKTPIVRDPFSGRLDLPNHKPYPYRYALANGLSLAGKVVAAEPPWKLYEVRHPLRLTHVTEGVYGDDWMGKSAALTQHAGSSGRLPILLSRANWLGPDIPGHVTLEVGKPVLGADGKLRLVRPLVRRTFVLHRFQARNLEVPVPRPPYRVEIHIDSTFSPAKLGLTDARKLGAAIYFGAAPGTRRGDAADAP